MQMQMREILFRGKSTDNGEWVEGFYYESKISGCFILMPKIKARKKDGIVIGDTFDVYEIVPETVGRYTGLTDKTGAKIFEGDIVGKKYTVYERVLGIVRFGKHSTFYGDEKENQVGFYINWSKGDDIYLRRDIGFWNTRCKVIGNIHDNPELLKDATGEDIGNAAQDALLPAT